MSKYFTVFIFILSSYTGCALAECKFSGVKLKSGITFKNEELKIDDYSGFRNEKHFMYSFRKITIIGKDSQGRSLDKNRIKVYLRQDDGKFEEVSRAISDFEASAEHGYEYFSSSGEIYFIVALDYAESELKSTELIDIRFDINPTCW